jgi:hypothetical protein
MNRSVGRLRSRIDPWLATDRGVRSMLNGIVLVGFLLRVYVAYFTHLPQMDRDSYEYFSQADKLLAGGYVNYFPQGYPFIIALFKLIAGDRAAMMLIAMNVLMSTLTIWFVFDIGKRIFRRVSIGLIAALIVAVLPTQLNYVRWLMTEVPTAFFLLGAFFFYFRGRKWLSGLFFGLATIVRTDEAPIFVLLFALALLWERRWDLRMLAGAILPLLLVGFYCYSKTGNFSIAGHSRINIMYSITASGGYVDWYYQDKHPEVTTTGQAVKLYIDHMKADPGGYVKQKLANLWELWGFYPSSSDGNRGRIARLGIGLENVFMLLFGLYGWWQNRRSFSIFVLILPFAVALPLHTLLLALPRYTYPVEPFMVLLGAWTLYRIGMGRTAASLVPVIPDG